LPKAKQKQRLWHPNYPALEKQSGFFACPGKPILLVCACSFIAVAFAHKNRF